MRHTHHGRCAQGKATHEPAVSYDYFSSTSQLQNYLSHAMVLTIIV